MQEKLREGIFEKRVALEEVKKAACDDYEISALKEAFSSPA